MGTMADEPGIQTNSPLDFSFLSTCATQGIFGGKGPFSLFEYDICLSEHCKSWRRYNITCFLLDCSFKKCWSCASSPDSWGVRQWSATPFGLLLFLLPSFAVFQASAMLWIPGNAVHIHKYDVHAWSPLYIVRKQYRSI